MGIFLTATVFLVVVCSTFGAEENVVIESEPLTEADFARYHVEIGEKFFVNPCISQQTCRDCIAAHPDCAWCSKEGVDYTAGEKKRCNYAHIIEDECGEHDMVNISTTWDFKENISVFEMYMRPRSAYEMRGLYLDLDRDIPSLAFLVDNVPENVHVTLYLSCSEFEPLQRKTFCRDLKKFDRVNIKPRIEFLACPANRDEWNSTIHIHELHGVVSTVFNIRMQLICECDCEKSWNEERNSPKCSGKGTYHCGICSCDDNRYGKECECEGKESGDEACISPGDSRICSGRGSCRCGTCECFDKTNVSGRFCECDTYSCPRAENGQICGGKDRGKCVCGKCECAEKWKGPACDCTTDIEPCRSKFNGEICHGSGECKCGKCHCFEKDGILASGPYCEDCETCPLECEKYKMCLRCLEHTR